MERIAGLIFILYVLISAVSDLRTRYISLSLSTAAALAGICLMIVTGGDIASIAFSILPGVSIIIISWFSGEAVGSGDGIFMMVVGIYMGLKDALIVLIYAWMAAGAMGLIYITAIGVSGHGRDRKNLGVPFVTVMAAVIIIIKAGVLNV